MHVRKTSRGGLGEWCVRASFCPFVRGLILKSSLKLSYRLSVGQLGGWARGGKGRECLQIECDAGRWGRWSGLGGELGGRCRARSVDNGVISGGRGTARIGG